MSTNTRRVIFDFLGRTGDLDRALDHTSRRLAELDGKFDSTSRGLLSVGAAGISVAGPLLAAGAAAAGFAAVAGPSIMKVVAAQEDLATSYADLTKGQQVAALQVKSLSGEFKKLSESFEPEALGVLRTFVDIGKGELPTLEKLVRSNAGAVQEFAEKLGGFAAGPMRDFLNFSSKMGPQALNTLGSTMTNTGQLALTLIQDTAPLGLSLLQVANGGLSMANSLAQANPELTQLALGTLLLRGPLGAVAGAASGAASRFRDAAGAGQGLSRSAKLANLAAAAGPGLWITAGAALAYWAIKAGTAKSASQQLVDTLKVETGAVGNNIEGYRRLINELQPRLIEAQKELSKEHERGTKMTGEQIEAFFNSSAAASAQSKAMEQATGAVSNLEKATALLGEKYGITTDQARQLATAAGADLSKSLDKNGNISAEAAAKIEQYSASVRLASDPTRLIGLALETASNKALSLEQRMGGLQAAFDAYLNPSLAVYNATISMKQGMQEFVKELAKAKGGMAGNSAESLKLQQGFAEQIATVQELANATFAKTKSVDAASKAVRNQLPILYALAGNSKSARTQVDLLADATRNSGSAMNASRKSFLAAAESMGLSRKRAGELWREFEKLKSKNIGLNVYANGKWTGPTNPGLVPEFHGYSGGPVPALGPGASRSRDSVPAMLRVDEHVWTPEEVDQVGGHEAMYRLRAAARRGMLQGYAKGGRVSLSHDPRSNGVVLNELMQPIKSGYTAMISEIGRAFAAAWKGFASGGGIVAAARSQIGTPYSWGGGGPGGPSYGIGRGAGTVGFDCSGLTEYAWWKGKGIRIGGWTGDQHPNSRPISGPRAGALGFPHMGHVVIASNKPGMVIEAPFTGGFVREVPKTMSDWRWPKAAGYATGGKVRKWGEDFAGGYTVGGDRALIDMAGIAGGRRRARGGPVAPGVSYLVGEHAPEVFTPSVGGHVGGAGTVVHNHYWTVNVPPTTDKGAVGREIDECLAVYESRGGRPRRR